MTNLPPEVTAQLQALERRKQMAQMLQQQAMQGRPTEMLGTHASRQSPLGGIARALTAGIAGNTLQGLDKESAGIVGGHQQQQIQNMQQLGGLPLKDRIARALSMPGMQQQAMEWMKALDSETFSDTAAVIGPDGQPKGVRQGNRGSTLDAPLPFKSPIMANDQAIDPYTTQKKADFRDQWKFAGSLPGVGPVQQSDTGKLDEVGKSPKVSVGGAQTIIKGQNAGAAEWAKLAGQDVQEMAKSARGAVKMLGTLNQLEASGKAGIFSGPAATPQTWVAGMLRSMNLPVDEAKLANSQTFEAASISAWQDMIAQAGGNRGVVKEEAARIAQMVPQLTQSPEGRAQLTAFLKQAAQQSIADAEKAQKEYAEAIHADDPRKFTFGLSGAQLPRTEGLPAAPGAATPAGSPVALPPGVKRVK